jgi:hypothetical protein
MQKNKRSKGEENHLLIIMPENEPEPEIKSKRNNNNVGLKTARLAAFLDFYSDRATAHASLFVASLFGIFTLLAIVQNLSGFGVWASIIIYFALIYAGYFTLVRFGFYADISQRITEGLEQRSTFKNVKWENKVEKEKENLFKYLTKANAIQQKILFPKEIIRRLGRSGLYLMAFFYWGITSFFGLIVYSKHLTVWTDWIIWISVFVVLVLMIVVLPSKYPSMYSYFKKAD